MTLFAPIFQRRILHIAAAALLFVSCSSGDEKTNSERSRGESATDSPSASVEGDLKVPARDSISVERGGPLENSSVMYLIPEAKNHELQSSLAIDYWSGGKATTSSDDSLAEGTTVSSYLLHFDSKGGGETVLSGKAVLPEPVVGVISSGSKLDASDKKLGVSTVTYPEQGLGKYRTINLNQADAMSVSSDRQTVQVNLHNWKGIDQMRILTASQ